MSVESLILEGLYLMLVGMGFVICFLTLLVLTLGLIEKYVPPDEVVDSTDKDTKLSNSRLTAVISAAINQHRKR